MEKESGIVMVTVKEEQRGTASPTKQWYQSMNGQVNGAEQKDQKFLNIYGNVVHDKGDVSNQWGKDGIFSKQFWDNQVAIWGKKLDLYFPS